MSFLPSAAPATPAAPPASRYFGLREPVCLEQLRAAWGSGRDDYEALALALADIRVAAETADLQIPAPPILVAPNRVLRLAGGGFELLERAVGAAQRTAQGIKRYPGDLRTCELLGLLRTAHALVAELGRFVPLEDQNAFGVAGDRLLTCAQLSTLWRTLGAIRQLVQLPIAAPSGLLPVPLPPAHLGPDTSVRSAFPPPPGPPAKCAAPPAPAPASETEPSPRDATPHPSNANGAQKRPAPHAVDSLSPRKSARQ